MRKKSVLLLLICNWVLLGTAAVMDFYAYPRLPQKIPLWLNFFGQQTILTDKSPLFFIYLLTQALFFTFFLVMTRRISSKKMASSKAPIFKEYVYLTLIFFNLIFIHVQRSIILAAHHVGQGIDKYYFYLLFAIILVLIPYYRIRVKLSIKKPEETK
ncbi:MAG: hypothetical protein GTO16_11600 [Candidatus Aminicenantes bacterium]|nr:hypothetical protein [Candidatus Aminicenantes bacterium]